MGISIFNYNDYRIFLKDFYNEAKSIGEDFSFRIFAKRAGFTSPNFLKLVMDNKKNLGRESLSKIANAMQLKTKEAEYFNYLVFFNQSKTIVEKNYYYGLMASYKTGSSIAKIQTDQFDYYSHWYIPVIRELIKDKEENTDHTLLADQVSPSIKPKEAMKAIRLLKKLGFIKLDESGKYVQTSALINTDRDLQSLAIRNFHSQMITLAKDSIECVSPEKREISSVTAHVSQKGFCRLKTRIQEFREELLQIVAEDNNVDRVYQINFQLFPLSKEPETPTMDQP